MTSPTTPKNTSLPESPETANSPSLELSPKYLEAPLMGLLNQAETNLSEEELRERLREVHSYRDHRKFKAAVSLDSPADKIVGKPKDSGPPQLKKKEKLANEYLFDE